MVRSPFFFSSKSIFRVVFFFKALEIATAPLSPMPHQLKLSFVRLVFFSKALEIATAPSSPMPHQLKLSFFRVVFFSKALEIASALSASMWLPFKPNVISVGIPKILANTSGANSQHHRSRTLTFGSCLQYLINKSTLSKSIFLPLMVRSPFLP